MTEDIQEIADDLVWNSDKWLPADDKTVEEFMSMNHDERVSFINDRLDLGLERRPENYDPEMVSSNREELCSQIVKGITGGHE